MTTRCCFRAVTASRSAGRQDAVCCAEVLLTTGPIFKDEDRWVSGAADEPLGNDSADLDFPPSAGVMRGAQVVSPLSTPFPEYCCRKTPANAGVFRGRDQSLFASAYLTNALAGARPSRSAVTLSRKASSAMAPSSPPLRWRTETVRASASLPPTTSM